MAQVPYEHVEAPHTLSIDGVRAFNPGDPVPVDTARRLGLLDSEDSPPVLPAYGEIPAGFVDGVITVGTDSPAGTPDPEHPASGDQAPDGTTADAAPTPPVTEDASTKAAPPQAPVVAPPMGQRSTPTP